MIHKLNENPLFIWQRFAFNEVNNWALCDIILVCVCILVGILEKLIVGKFTVGKIHCWGNSQWGKSLWGNSHWGNSQYDPEHSLGKH